MLYLLPDDIQQLIYYNKLINHNNLVEEIEEKIEIKKPKVYLRNLMLTNKSLFKFIFIKYEKLFLSNFDTNFKKMLEKYNTFYEVDIIEANGIIKVNKFKNCFILCLRNCFNITNVSILSNVQYLDLSNCFEINDVSMLGNCKKLELCNCDKITDVSNLGNVPYLNLSHCHNIYNISNLGNHIYLNLKGTNIYNVDNLENVKFLDISYNLKISNIDKLSNVYSLDISSCFNIKLNKIMNNKILIANETNLVNNDVPYLQNIYNLKLLRNYYISDLSPLKKTKILDIRQCTNIKHLPKKNILDYICVSRNNYYTNLVNLDIHTLNIKTIDIDNFY